MEVSCCCQDQLRYGQSLASHDLSLTSEPHPYWPSYSQKAEICLNPLVKVRFCSLFSD